MIVGGGVLIALIATFAVVNDRVGSVGDDREAVTGRPSGPIEGSRAVAFPDPASVTRPAEERLRPVGLRHVEIGLEDSVIADPGPASCSDRDVSLERVVWIDRPMSQGGPASVAPGEHGTAVLIAGSDPGAFPAPLLGLERVSEGSIVEVARSNGTVLRWRVMGVVDLPADAPFPESVLEPAPEQRLVIVGCGADLDGRTRDVYILALRAP